MCEIMQRMRLIHWPGVIACVLVILGTSVGRADSWNEMTVAEERMALIEQLTARPEFLPPGTPPLPRCVNWGNIYYMMPGMLTQVEAAQFVNGLPELPRERRYQPINSWIKTATDGRVSVPGERITLTWSFVPDGTQLYDSYTGGTSPSNLHSVMNARFGNEQLWKDQFRRAFQEYGELIGVNYAEVSDDGASQPAVARLGVRGDVRIGMIVMPENGPLAYNFIPDRVSDLGKSDEGYGGDMTFNSTLISLIGAPSNFYRYLRNIIMHEHGHGLGFDHVGPINSTKLMEPFLVTSFDGPQEDDTRGFQSLYGDRLEPNDDVATATALPPLPTEPFDSPLVYTGLAVEHSQARDYFSFNVPEFTILKVEVEPVGATYSQGPVTGPFGTVNGRAVLDLAIDVMNANGTLILDTVDKEGPGGTELARTPLMDGAGSYTFRVRSKGVSGQSQRYRMVVSRVVGEIDAVYRETAVIVDDSTGNATGTVDPGERNVDIWIPLLNEGFSFGTPFYATLESDLPTVTVTNPTVHYGLAHSGEIANQDQPYRISVSSQHDCGEPIAFRLKLDVPNRPQELELEIETGITGLGPFRRYASSAPGIGPLPHLKTSSIQVPASFPVGAIRITNLNVTGSGLENQRMVLTAPDASQIVLSDGSFRGSYLKDTELADNGKSIQAGLAPYTGTFRPLNPFAGLFGAPPAGEWRLSILHKTGAPAAVIDSWTLELAPIYEEAFCEAPVLPPVEVFETLAIY